MWLHSAKRLLSWFFNVPDTAKINADSAQWAEMPTGEPYWSPTRDTDGATAHENSPPFPQQKTKEMDSCMDADKGNRMPTRTGPWASVPPDVLYYICDQAFSGTSAHYGVERLVLVCKDWYQIIMGHRRLWRTIRIESDLNESTVYPTMQSYVNTRLRHSHHYPLDVTIYLVEPEQWWNEDSLEKDMESAIGAVLGHAYRWETLNAILHPHVRARLKNPTPILRRVALDGIHKYGWNLSDLFPIAPKLHVLSLTCTGDEPVLGTHLPASTYVTLNHLQLAGFSLSRCISISWDFAKTRQLTTLELTGTWNYAYGGPLTLPSVHTLILNAQGPMSIVFSTLTLPVLVHLAVVGGGNDGGRKHALDGRDSFIWVASKLETLSLEFVHFDCRDHLKSILAAAPKVKWLVIRDIAYGTSADPILKENGGEGTSGLGKSSEPDYIALLKDPLIFPILRQCMVDDTDREDLVLLRANEPFL
jgi:F-box-like